MSAPGSASGSGEPQRPPATAAQVPPARPAASPFSAYDSRPEERPTTPAPAVHPSSAAAASAFRPLNVRDALQYLDRVKQQFSSEYEVYDQFLNIMKDFKTQNIDTPGVIDRVSTLFRGHPSLIQGFNTFLPPGYRIECSVSAPNEEGASNTITVTTPMGVTTRTQDVTGVEAREFVRSQPRPATATTAASTTTTMVSPIPLPTATPARPAIATGSPAVAPNTSTEPNKAVSTPPVLPPLPTSLSGSSTTSAAPTPSRILSPPAQIPPYGSRRPHLPSRPIPDPSSRQSSSTPIPGTSTAPATPAALPRPARARDDSAEAKSNVEAADAADAIVHSANTAAATTSAPTPIMEFNHAINYVNKIKNRFTKDPETYKTFLEILQTYQKETRPIQEVYTQVTALFHSAPDLLDEFKAFLPDTTDQGAAASSSAGVGQGQKKKEAAKVRDDSRPAVQRKPVVEEKKKRAAPGMGERAKAKRAKTSHALHAESPPPVAAPSKADRAAALSEPVPISSYHSQPYGALPPGFPGAPRMQSAYDSYLVNHRTPALVQTDEFGFFDRVKKYLDDRAAYTEFLKLLNLFTQEIIDVSTLLEKSLLFIGGSDELVGAFKDLVGWDPVKDGRISGEDWIIDNEPVLERPKVELHIMKAFGPSYRKLPDSEIDLACSGRDALEWSVLNDEWVAFATWASEGSGAHRKNVYEDALYNSEQERHWYSFQIESNLRVIHHLEPIAARIAQMGSEDRASLRLEEGLGGESPSVYERVIRKIWGKDQGWEILRALEDNPCVAVPIVLSRLKQKDEEWKRAEREWNKVWREVDAKNFYRALDHQAIPFKAVDKKISTTSKSLTTEIETLRRDKQQKQFDLDATTPLRPLHQFELGMADRDVLFDVLKLCFSFLDRDQSGTSAPERARVEAFLRLFVPLFFGVPHSDMEANLAHSNETPEVEEEEVESELEGGTSDGESSAFGEGQRNGINKKGGVADFRKRLLTHAATAAARGGGPRSGSRANSPTGEDGAAPTVGVLGEQMWIQLNAAKEDDMVDDEPLPARRFNFFANATFYCLVRIIHTLYHRLSDFKRLCAKQAADHKRRLSPLGVKLGLSTPVPIIDEGENPAEHYYEHALDLAEKLFDGDLDQQTYEEHLRYMGGVKAYPLFTIDKLIQTVIKHIHTINGDAKCQDLVTLLEKDRAREYTTPRQQIAYRMEAETLVGAEENNLYRLEWIPEAKALTIQLLGKEDLTLDDAYGNEAKMHESWVASFALTSATEGIGAQVKVPLLKRNRMLSAAEDPQEFDLAPGLEAKVNDDSYQLSFVANTEDYLHRRRPVEPEADSATVLVEEKRKKRFEKWLETATAARGEVDEVPMEL